MDPTQKAQAEQLRAELAALGHGGVAAEDEIRELAADLQSMAIQPPDPDLVHDLAGDLQGALSDSSLSPVEMAQLSQSVYAVLNSAGLDATEVQVLVDDVEAILLAADVSSSDVQAVVSSLQDVAGSVGAAAPPSTAPTSSLRSRFRRLGGR
ncbi:MAG: hypothetical protein AAGM22_26205 [Acidobacteriota bacterium]